MKFRRKLAAVLAAFVVLMGLGVGSASADPRSSSFTWTDGNGNTCTIYGSVATYSSGGNVVVNARVSCSKAGKDGTLNIAAAKGPNGKQYGIGSPWCTQACSVSVKIPYTGPGTYTATVYYWDDDFAADHGHDPLVRLGSYVSR
jgi:hypothetical protein